MIHTTKPSVLQLVALGVITFVLAGCGSDEASLPLVQTSSSAPRWLDNNDLIAGQRLLHHHVNNNTASNHDVGHSSTRYQTELARC